ncbi:TPA: hypothetical protein RP325_003642 [Acinetobacter baumannii]|uniref:hypothetical protein n=1 Tax=Acinetobacter baumannii TaxID=470 RepID=UPI0002D13DC4|nr:hypothetical protein [Acinetobacter baumannii]ENW35623.1 hypothetical protein F922_01489 [Acinetobacter baumannii NIPH 201]MEB6638167.1 hypothetical protein [Acinetobacter baumannii]TPS94086.1 hypothetical protein FJU76_10040 [Acinetobacter baumannii]HBI8872452.1 hypothetical protein [Acinetobacter baumannii]HDX5830207.1 hypothetical protein [Acinetobacter baumannii]
MYSLQNLPENFKEIKELNICSNKIIDGGFPFSLGDKLPLIVGDGKEPKIWLQALKSPKSKELILLVDENISTDKEIIVTKPEEGVIEIYFQKTIKVLRVKKKQAGNILISYIDLRPLGLNITGNPMGLNIGGSSFSNNTIQGTKVFIGLG